MELFVINRYEGEQPIQTESSTNHLAELLKRIEERKKQRAAGIVNSKTGDDTSEPRKPEKTNRKKSRKRKLPETSEVEKAPSEDGEKVKLANDGEKVELANNGEKVELANDDEKVQLANDDEKPRVAEAIAPNEDFTVLGFGSQKRKKIVKRVLPGWLARPEVISAELSSGPSVDDLGEELDSKLVQILRANGVEKLFPVQSNVIAWLSKCHRDRRMGWWPRDTCVSAPTGSGKTLAYVLPIVQQLQSRFVPKIRCLAVLPVQELAAQVHKVFLTYSAHTNLKVALISGATSFDAEQANLVKKSQRGQYMSRVDIVVATPGRLVDHIEKTEGFSLEALKFLVIDEADRATDWLQYIPPPHSRAPPLTLGNALASSHPPAQKLLFSATLSQDPEKLSRLGLFQPILFTSVAISGRDDDVDLDRELGDFTGRYTSPDELEERAVQCDPEYKPLALRQLIANDRKIEKALVFTNSGNSAHRLTLLLRSLLRDEDVIVDELSAHLAPKQRTEVLERFSTGGIHVLVSSDALARGLDIPGVKLVVAYDLPKHIEGYIHRAGRTGRAGTPGTAISLLVPNQTAAFTRMLTSARKTVPKIEIIDGLDAKAEKINYPEHIAVLKETLEKEKTEVTEKAKGKRRHKAKH